MAATSGHLVPPILSKFSPSELIHPLFRDHPYKRPLMKGTVGGLLGGFTVY
jgi:hypothetical protein